MNNVLKQVTNWKTLTLPNLINTMSDCIENRLAELKRSLYNSGHYRLQPNYRHVSMPLAEWRVLTETEWNEKFVQFLLCDITLEKEHVVSGVLDVKTPAAHRINGNPKWGTVAIKPNFKIKKLGFTGVCEYLEVFACICGIENLDIVFSLLIFVCINLYVRVFAGICKYLRVFAVFQSWIS